MQTKPCMKESYLVEKIAQKKLQEINNILDIDTFTGIKLSGKRIALNKMKTKLLKVLYYK